MTALRSNRPAKKIEKIEKLEIVIESLGRTDEFKSQLAEVLVKHKEEGWDIQSRDMSATGALVALIWFEKEQV